MKKKFPLSIIILSLFLLSSCVNVLDNSVYGNNQLSFGLGKSVADSISRAATVNEKVTEDTKFSIVCKLLRGDAVIKEMTEVVTLTDLYITSFSFDNIPNGNNYFISLEISYNNYLIYDALSDVIILNEDQEDVSVNLQLVQHDSNIKFVLNGGKFSTDTRIPSKYFINSNTNMPEPVKDMSKFDGWYLSDKFIPGEKITTLGKSYFAGDITLYAKWTELSKVSGVKIIPEDTGIIDFDSTVTLKSDTSGASIYYTLDGTEPSEKSMKYNEKVPVSVKDFWKNDDTVIVKAIASKEGMITSDITEKTYTMKRYTVSFNVNSKEEISSPEVIKNLKKGDVLTVEQLVKLTSKNSEFQGWYDGDVKVEPGVYKITKDTKLTAKWQEIVKPVTFAQVPGEAQGKIDYTDSVYLESVTTGAVIYYTTDGSNPSDVSGGRKEYDPKTGIAVKDLWNKDSVKIRAMAEKTGAKPSEVTEKTYTMKRYTVSFDPQDPKAPPLENIPNLKKGDEIKAERIPILEKADHEFLGWQYNGAEVKAGYIVTSDMILTPSWRAFDAVADVTFSVGAGDIDAGTEVTLESKTPGAKIYYTTDGTEPTTGGSVYDGTTIKITEDTTIKAFAAKAGMKDSKVTTVAYKVLLYKVSFETNDSSLQAPSTVTGLKKGDTLTENQLVKLEKADHEFLGWQYNGADVKAGYVITGSMVLTPNWREFDPVANVTFSVAEGGVDYGATVTLATTTPEATIYYTTDESDPLTSPDKKTGTGPITITKDTTIKAIATKTGMKNSVVQTSAYTIKNYTVTFDTNGHGTLETAASTAQFHKDEVFAGSSKLPVLSQDGYKFDGWCKDSGATTVVTAHDKMGITATTLYAKWTPITYTVKFAGGTPNDIPCTYDVPITLPMNDGTKSGYEANGWRKSEADGSFTHYDSSAEVSNLTTVDNGTVTLEPDWNNIAPTAISIKFPVSADGKVTLSWDPKETDISSVMVYNGDTEITTNITATKNEQNVINGVVIEGLTNGTSYSFKVKLKDDGGLTSGDSNVVGAIPNPEQTLTSSVVDKTSYLLLGDYPQSLKAANIEINTTSVSWGQWTTCYLGSDNRHYVQVGSNYYKIEPIEWTVINSKYTDTASSTGRLALANKVLDVSKFDDNQNTYHHNGTAIQSFVNGVFVKAFSSDAQNKINSIELEYKNNKYLNNAIIISKNEAADVNIGPKECTAYANRNGTVNFWWTRTGATNKYVSVITTGGNKDATQKNIDSGGVVPAILLK